MMLQFITYLLKPHGKMDLQNGPVVCSKLFCEQPFTRPQPWEWMMFVEPSLQRWRQSTLTPKVLATALLKWFLERIHELWELLEQTNFAHGYRLKLELMKQVLQECKQ